MMADIRYEITEALLKDIKRILDVGGSAIHGDIGGAVQTFKMWKEALAIENGQIWTHQPPTS